MTSLLVTNDFPPKVGGIQSYLFELWRRLPTERHAVLTRAQPNAEAFDASSPVVVRRIPARVLLPTPSVASAVRAYAKEIGAGFVVFDPALPLGHLGPQLGIPYGLILHGAEVTVPSRLPVTSKLLRRVLEGADLVIAAGSYPAQEARRLTRGAIADPVVIPPGVDGSRFELLDAARRSSARALFGLAPDAQVIVGVSRLVPRKGFDVLIEAAAELRTTHPDLAVAIAGAGRDETRLRRLIRRLRAPVRLLGRVSDEDLPLLVGSADIFSMLCRTRWGGLEQEGFGIVFLEAAAAGVPQVAGRSGGSHEAVLDQVTGLVVDRPADLVVASSALARLLDDEDLRRRMGSAARSRALEEFNYESLAARLEEALSKAEAGEARAG
ncbi:MAG: glycosyltransferase family 4 protein [Acidimicrobiales bacterium]